MTAIKQTRIKFFTVMALIVVVIISAFCSSIIISIRSNDISSTNAILEEMISSFEKPPIPNNFPPNNNRFNTVRGFTVRLDIDFNITASNYNEMVYSKTEIEQYVDQISKTNKTNGEISNIRYILKDIDNGSVLACLDVSMENTMFSQLLATVLLAGGGGIIVLLVLVWFLSYWIIKPTEAAFNKQKQFVSEAGHELKTPITIILAGIELLQKRSEESDREKWLDNIKEQVYRMSEMTTELLALSKIDENIKTIKTEFDLSQTILSECLAFESVAFENNKTLVCETDNNLIYKGNYQAICKAIGILCDNAIKYSNLNTAINVRLKKQGNKIAFSISNECNDINKEETTLFFERFYRGSEWRSKISGTGLGLAILKTLADQNDWKLNVDTYENKIIFTIIF